MEARLHQFNKEPGTQSSNIPLQRNARLHSVMYYTGVSASGKDFLLDRAFEDDGIASRVTRLSMGRMMASKLSMDRDTMIKKDGIDSIRDVQAELVPDLISVGPTVMNAHLVSKYNGVLVVNPQFEIDLRPQQYVVVYSDPELIRQRRIARNGLGQRQSDIEDEATRDLHQRLAITTSRTLAEYHGSGLTVIYNGDNNTEDNVALLKDRISALT